MDRTLVIKSNYVIDVIMTDPLDTKYEYPHPHDKTVVDNNCNVGPGDWYEESEGIFYRPLSRPTDLPEELH